MTGFVPMSLEQRQKMLETVGLTREQLFAHIPDNLKLKQTEFEGLNKEGISEMEIELKLMDLAAKNANSCEYDSYLGAGLYDHFSPYLPSYLIQRSEFLTAYTPYQPEISQGTLRATFEWQTYMCRLTGMDLVNASMYDGASAAAEAALMAFREKRKAKKVWISAGLNPEYIDTIKTYLHAGGFEYEVGELNADGTACGTYPEAEGYAAFFIQSPNFYGQLEDLDSFVEAAHAQKALATAVMDPLALTMLATPGDKGVDIVVGEAQPLGVPVSFGGPALGYMGCTEKLMRKMPGRIVGRTEDKDGNDVYVLTLQAREQHIRRDRATSNICTSQQLIATLSNIHMALMGRDGLLEAAEQSAAKAIYLQKKLIETGLFKAKYEGPFFREFALVPQGFDLNELNHKLLDKKIIGGLVLEENGEQNWLLAVTEKKTKAKLDRFVEAVVELAK
ncbi:MAG: aminomethyl-transferring glycine dehydrogenase subunit GcvPA [Eubacteriales bacterium]|nr:aminomethyl-transferring glycine dehydrogenase subunit GcvPA [Eubacteriales bacterium]